jgi:hypothetical protein
VTNPWLTERHFPSPVPPTEKKEKPARKCHVCANTTKSRKLRRTPDICVPNVK